ncbi:MAG: L,D-transpeptidase family protein [Bacteroidota bacterium]
MKFPLYFIFFIVGIYSCTNSKPNLKQETPKRNLASEFVNDFKENYNNILPKNTKLLDTFYNTTSFQPIWFNDSLLLNKAGKDFLKILAKANQYGLEPKQYSIEKIQEIYHKIENYDSIENKIEWVILLEKLLTKNYFIFGKHLNFGLIENIDTLTALPRKEFTIQMSNYLLTAFEKDSVIDYLLALQPSQEEYRNLQNGLVKFLERSSLSKEKVKVVSIKSDSLKALDQARKALVHHNFIPDKATDTIFIRGLRKFQYEHGLKPDGVIGTNTARALSKSPYEYYQSAAVSLERWRWKPIWEKDFIYVNIPAYNLLICLGDTLKRKHRVVVGTSYNRTPEVYSKLSYIVAYPYWHVPKSISVNEILVKQKKDSNYIRKNNFEIFTNELDSVSSTSVNWDTITSSNFNYYFRQKGGSSNALGLVKFIFDNKYSIYLHDTPTKYHFYRELRTYSHGCVRVQDAIEMADNILKYDENIFTIDSVFDYVEKHKEKKMMLNKKLPVYIQYIVCDTDAENTIIFYKDIYKKDDEVIKLLFYNQSVKDTILMSSKN